jgi:5-formyltetrahydrofolate cyclo-ligase
MALPEYARAATVMAYVSVRDELRTRRLLDAVLKSDKRLVVPYCVRNELKLFVMESFDELAPGMLGIPEPKVDLRSQADKQIDIAALELIVVPGVAFDRRGGRLGHGKGYYDRMLVRARPDTALVGVSYNCQVFPEIPMQPHDVFMQMVVTETDVHA